MWPWWWRVQLVQHLHLVDLAAEKLQTFFINGPECLSPERIKHFDYHAESPPRNRRLVAYGFATAHHGHLWCLVP